MEPSSKKNGNDARILLLAGILFLTGILAASFLFGGSPAAVSTAPCICPAGGLHEPVFTDPAEKLRELSNPGYTETIFSEAVALEPLLATPGTQVHMGFYSAKGNHGSLLRLLDDINEGPAADAVPPNRAIWVMGVNGYYQYPSWVRVMDERWYERGNAGNSTVIIAGKAYHDPYNVTIGQADAIWSQYSMRFAGMAEPVARATGKPVMVWCFVEGAKPYRIFYTSEYTVLKNLEEKGVVVVHFAKNQQASYDNPADWTIGTASAPPPAG